METNVANLHFFFWGIIKESRFLLGVIDIYSKYDRVVLIEDKRGEATMVLRGYYWMAISVRFYEMT